MWDKLPPKTFKTSETTYAPKVIAKPFCPRKENASVTLFQQAAAVNLSEI